MRSAALTTGTIAAAQAAARSVRRGAARAWPPFSGRTGAGLISPGGFEEFFAELGSGAAPPDAGARDGLEFDLESIPRLCEEHGLTFAMPGD